MAKEKYISLSSRAADLTDKRFNLLTALGPVKSNQYGFYWECQCDCGNVTVVRAAKLTRGEIKSCGCIVGKNGTHGMTHTREFSVWGGIKERCLNPNCKSYPNYGGRGISVSNEWLGSFEKFYDHVSQLPHCGERGYSIDRIDNDGNYEPGNVRWATKEGQRRNQRRCRRVTVGDIALTLAGWSERNGLARRTIEHRLKAGWPERDAVSKPSQRAEYAALAASVNWQ